MNADDLKQIVVPEMNKWTDDERLHFLNLLRGHYCLHCGRVHFGQRQCQCSNDE